MAEKFTRRVVIQEDPKTFKRIQAAADERGTCPSAYIREAVRERLRVDAANAGGGPAPGVSSAGTSGGVGMAAPDAAGFGGVE